MSPKQKCRQSCKIIKTKILPKLKGKKTEISEISLKPKCHQKLNVNKTEMSPKLKYHQN